MWNLNNLEKISNFRL